MVWKVFYSYSHEPKDAELRKRLGIYLAPLVDQKKIVEWYDRKIEPGETWDSEISAQLDSADLILLLISADFLASKYCFGVEVEKALTRLKQKEVKVVPVLLSPCLWKQSRFSELQIIPRDARPITSWPDQDLALNVVAEEIADLVKQSPPALSKPPDEQPVTRQFDSSLDLVRSQVRGCANQYERMRQRMPPSDERTRRMESIFGQMRELATASYPLLDELASSPSPGERLAALAILHVFASNQSLPFLVDRVSSEEPFIGYQAAKALRFAVGSLTPSAYPQLLSEIRKAQAALESTGVGGKAGRQKELQAAERELQDAIGFLDVPGPYH